MKNSTTYELAAPGAGLPKLELTIAKILFRLQCLTGNRESFNQRFQEERDKIRDLVVSCRQEDGAARVLIRRLPGLEDSSRDWSVWMTLDHLRIVHLEIAKVFELLGQGIEPQQKVSTATVKPSPDVTGAVVKDYDLSCDVVMSAVAAVKELHTPVRLAHPWFGPMDAFAWHALMAVHIGIHRRQIERILSEIAAG